MIPMHVVGTLTVLIFLIVSSSRLFSQMLPQVIYGEDDRRDLHQVNDVRWQKLARATALLVERRHLQHLQDSGSYRLHSEPVGEKYGLCRHEAFWQQPSAGYCSGFLVGADVLVTAAHCLREAGACAKLAVVFGYSYRGNGSDPAQLSPDNVYFCKGVLARVYEIADGLDFAVLRLDRAVQERLVLPLRAKGKVTRGEKMTVVGHPLGLPTKVTHGQVRSGRDRDYFIINADLWTGSSAHRCLTARQVWWKAW